MRRLVNIISKNIIYKDLVAFHPGSYVEEIIEDLDITQSEFAKRLETTPKTLSKIINGESAISVDVANKLDKTTGVSLKTWLNLQANYDTKVMEIKNLSNQAEQDICQKIDFKYFKDNGYADPSKKYSILEKIEALRNLLNISSLTLLSEFNPLVSYRHNQKFTDSSIINSNIMLELATNKARNTSTTKFSKDKLINKLPEIKKMTLQDPSVFYPQLTKILLDCGIILVALPKLKNAGLNGATKKFKSGSVLLLITDKDKKEDIFWFSLIHELGHVYNKDFISNSDDPEKYYEKEQLADNFAKNFLIPQKSYEQFIQKNTFTQDSITEFANHLGISRGIVVGRLQSDGKIDYSEFNYLRDSYEFDPAS